MANDFDDENRDSLARLLAILAIIVGVIALVWAVRADSKAQEAAQTARDGVVEVQGTETDDPEAAPQTDPMTNTGTDDAGGAGTGVNNNGAPDAATP